MQQLVITEEMSEFEKNKVQEKRVYWNGRALDNIKKAKKLLEEANQWLFYSCSKERFTVFEEGILQKHINDLVAQEVKSAKLVTTEKEQKDEQRKEA